MFGAAEAFELRLQGFGVPVSSYIVQMAPYLIALAVLAGLGRSADAGGDRPPAAMGSVRAVDGDARALAAALESGRPHRRSSSSARFARIGRSMRASTASSRSIEAGARAAAKDSDARRARGAPRSPLEGVPISMKDNIHVAGLPSTWGSRALADYRREATNCRSRGCAAPAPSSSARRTCRS